MSPRLRIASARRAFAATWILALAFGLPATAQTLLVPGQPVQVNLPAGSFTTDLAVDVPDGIEQIRVAATGSPGVDIDLLVRHGEAFPVLGNAGVFGGVEWLTEHAHAVSVSPGHEEGVTITRQQRQPARAGRWHLALVNYGGTASTVNLLVTTVSAPPAPVPMQLVFDDQARCAQYQGTTTPWFDSTPASPVGGNSGTTLGEQRRNAFTAAMNQVRNELPGVASLRVLACWRDLGGDANSATVASAGPLYLFRDDGVSRTAAALPVFSVPTLPSTYTWYAGTAAAQLAGTELCRLASVPCSEPDIFIQFNSAIDGNVALGNRRFWYGLQPQPAQAASNVDFLTTAMHEVGHGLGFIGLANLNAGNGPIGEKFRGTYGGVREPRGHNDVYTDALSVIRNGNALEAFNGLPLADRAAALTSGPNLVWTDAEAVDSPLNTRRLQPFPFNHPPVYAPSTLAPGSTLSHLDQGFISQLMTPFVVNGLRTLGLARPMLSALGWRSGPAPLPAYAVPYGGQWYDPDRSGHGLDLHRVVGTPDTYILVLYTFDANGLPEWYLAIGRIVDGVFRPGNDANGNSLWRSRYLFGPPPGQQADTSVPGQIRIDFNQAARSPYCQDGTGRNAPLALMTFSLGSDRNLRWCLTQIAPSSARPTFDRTGHWYAGSADSGWGITMLGYGGGAEGGLFSVLYYPDAQGRPRWAGMQADQFVSGQVQPLFQVQGYCRTCPRPAGPNPVTQVGQIRIDLPTSGAPGQMRFNVTFQGDGGGSFARDPAPLVRLGDSGELP